MTNDFKELCRNTERITQKNIHLLFSRQCAPDMGKDFFCPPPQLPYGKNSTDCLHPVWKGGGKVNLATLDMFWALAWT